MHSKGGGVWMMGALVAALISHDSALECFSCMSATPDSCRSGTLTGPTVTCKEPAVCVFFQFEVVTASTTVLRTVRGCQPLTDVDICGGLMRQVTTPDGKSVERGKRCSICVGDLCNGGPRSPPRLLPLLVPAMVALGVAQRR